jgi:hypothetical protein
MNVLLLTSHAIAEHDDLEMFTRMGVPTYSIGGAYDELLPFEGKRPAIANLVRYPELEAATNEQRARMHRTYGDAAQVIDWAKARLAPEVIDWADTIIVHHFPEAWIGGQWNAIRDKRVIWRTCGQSDPRVENVMAKLRGAGPPGRPLLAQGARSLHPLGRVRGREHDDPLRQGSRRVDRLARLRLRSRGREHHAGHEAARRRLRLRLLGGGYKWPHRQARRPRLGGLGAASAR